MEDYWPYSVHTTESTEITDNVYLLFFDNV